MMRIRTLLNKKHQSQRKMKIVAENKVICNLSRAHT